MDETTVYRTWDESMAEMALGLLQAEGIDARKGYNVPRSIYPITMDGMGEIDIVVPDDEARIALEILAVRFSDDNMAVLDEEVDDSDFESDEIPDTDDDISDTGETGK